MKGKPTGSSKRCAAQADHFGFEKRENEIEILCPSAFTESKERSLQPSPRCLPEPTEIDISDIEVEVTRQMKPCEFANTRVLIDQCINQ